MSEHAALPPFSKLEGSSNYSSWKFQMELYLVHEDLWRWVSEEPDTGSASEVLKDKKARSKIGMMIKPHCLVHMMGSDTAKQTWESLRNAYQDKGVNNRCRLLRRLILLKLEQFQSMEEYVTEVLFASQRLRDIGKEVDDELLAALMLQGLSEEYEPLRMALDNSTEKITSDLVKTKLLQLKVKEMSEDSAMLARNKGKGQNKNYRKMGNAFKYNFRCFICNAEGHKAIDCSKNPNKRNNQRGQQSKCEKTEERQKKESARKAEANLLFLSAMTTRVRESEWYIDSGASTHMSNRKDWFVNYQETDKKEVNCANDVKLSSEGVGDVLVNLDNTRKRLTVNNVSYVSGLNANLLSVSAIVKKNMSVLFSEKGCEIFRKDNIKVQGEPILKVKEKNGIYTIDTDNNGRNIQESLHLVHQGSIIEFYLYFI